MSVVYAFAIDTSSGLPSRRRRHPRAFGAEIHSLWGVLHPAREASRNDFWVTRGKVGTPSHLAFHAANQRAVDAFYRAALAAGGKDNGAPGPRDEYGYAAFVLDPD